MRIVIIPLKRLCARIICASRVSPTRCPLHSCHAVSLPLLPTSLCLCFRARLRRHASRAAGGSARWLCAGVLLSVVSSIASNLGVNVQKFSLMREARRPTNKRRSYVMQPFWLFGADAVVCCASISALLCAVLRVVLCCVVLLCKRSAHPQLRRCGCVVFVGACVRLQDWYSSSSALSATSPPSPSLRSRSSRQVRGAAASVCQAAMHGTAALSLTVARPRTVVPCVRACVQLAESRWWPMCSSRTSG